MRKLSILFQSCVLILFAQLAQAHSLEVPTNFPVTGSWTVPINGTISVSVDGCTDQGTQSFRVISENPAEIYLRDDDPISSYWVWEITCELKDQTTGQIVKSYRFPTGAWEILANSHAQIYSELTNVAQNYSYFEFVNGHLIFLFENITVQNGHTYEGHFKIVNKNSFWGGTTTQTDSWTNSIYVNGNKTYTPNQWTTQLIQPSFTDVSIGDIVGNFGGNNEGYFIGSDNRVYNIVWSNNKWNIWCIDWNFTQAAPGSITVNPTNGEVYFIGTDGRVYNCVWANNQWNIWCIDWNFTQAAPGAISVNPSNGEVYFIGTDGRIYNCVWANNQWNIWCIDWNFTQAAPGAIEVSSSNGYVYFISTNGRVYNCVWANNQWNVWCLDWNFTNAAQGAISVNPNTNRVYIVGQDNRLYNCVWSNNQWNIWCMDWNFTNVATGALACNPMSGHVNFITLDDKVYNAVWANNQWNMWGLNNNNDATKGTLGVHQKVINGNLHDIVHTRDEQGRLKSHTWINCGDDGSVGKPGKEIDQVSPLSEDERAEIAAAKKSYYNSQRGFITTSVKDAVSTVGTLNVSIQPNPMVSNATIKFDLNKEEQISLSIVNVSGAVVKTIVANTQLDAGNHTYSISKESLSSGMYYVILQTETEGKKIEKLIIQ